MRNKTRLVYGVGINDADYRVKVFETVDGQYKQVWGCPFHLTWTEMLKRGYSEKFLVKNPSYVGSKVCDEWLRFSNFRAWMVDQEWQDENGKKMELDKDILSGSNRGKLYSPETCVFVSSTLNQFLAFEQSTNSGLPVGVTWHVHTEKYQARVCNPFSGKRESLGLFFTPEAAFAAYCARKKELAAQYAEIVTEPRLKQALLDFQVTLGQ